MEAPLLPVAMADSCEESIVVDIYAPPKSPGATYFEDVIAWSDYDSEDDSIENNETDTIRAVWEYNPKSRTL